MAIVATLNATLTTSGAIGGPVTTTIPTVTASAGLDIRQTSQLAAGFTTLTSIVGATLTGATGMWIIPGAGTTASSICWGLASIGATTGTCAQVGTAPNPVLITGGITTSGYGISLSAATTVEILIF